MVTLWLGLAMLMIALHLAVIVVLVAGGPLALRWPRFVCAHLVVAVMVGAVFLVGADCPVTTWQKHFLRLAGRPAYRGGFVEHYLVNPVTGGGMTTAMKVTVLATWILPTVLSYLVLWRRQIEHDSELTVSLHPHCN